MPLPTWSLWRPGRLSDSQRMILASELKEKGLAAETNSEWRRADFYWNQLSHVAQPDLDVWVGFALAHSAASGAKASLRAAALWERFLIAKPDPKQVRRHLAAIEEQAWKLVGDAKSKEAKSLADHLLTAAPNDPDVHQAWIDLTRASAMQQSKSANDSSRAGIVQEGIDKIKSKSAMLEYHSEYYRAVGLLEHQLAIYLASDSKMADALGAVARARTYDPAQQGIDESCNQLIESMKTFQEQISLLVAQVRARPNATLNAHGHALQVQANRGYAAMNDWNQGQEAPRISALRNDAGLKTIWRRVGLLPEDGWVEKSQILVQTLQPILDHPPVDRPALDQAISQLSAATPQLSPQNWQQIAIWLGERFFGEGTPPPLALQSLKEPPGRPNREEDFRDWLMAPSGLRVKLQIVVAAILLIVAGGLAGLEAYRSSARESDWKIVSAAVAKSDDPATIAAAESYLRHGRPRSEDPDREQKVRELYEEAVMRWVATQPETLAADGARRIETFQALMKNQSSDKGN